MLYILADINNDLINLYNTVNTILIIFMQHLYQLFNNKLNIPSNIIVYIENLTYVIILNA